MSYIAISPHTLAIGSSHSYAPDELESPDWLELVSRANQDPPHARICGSRKPGERVRNGVFVMVFRDDNAVFGITDVPCPFATSKCSGPTALACWKNGKVH